MNSYLFSFQEEKSMIKLRNLLYWLSVAWVLLLELTSGIFLYTYFTVAIVTGYLLNGLSAGLLIFAASFVNAGVEEPMDHGHGWYHLILMHLFWRVNFQTAAAYIIVLDPLSGAPYHYIVLGLPEILLAIGYALHTYRGVWLQSCRSAGNGYKSLV